MNLPSRLIRSVLLVSVSLSLAQTTTEAQNNGAGACRFPGDGVAGEPLRYRTQPDGTVLDLNTGLMWEIKDGGNGIHGIDRTFHWSATGTQPDGTVFTVFLDTLNNRCSEDETISCARNADCLGIGNGKCGYAGHRDWRLPNVRELHSIIDYGRFQPALDPIFGRTRPNSAPGPNYWSSTTSAQNANFAVFVNFDTGYASNDGKVFTFYGVGLPARAVRDDRCHP